MDTKKKVIFDSLIEGFFIFFCLVVFWIIIADKRNDYLDFDMNPITFCFATNFFICWISCTAVMVKRKGMELFERAYGKILLFCMILPFVLGVFLYLLVDGGSFLKEAWCYLYFKHFFYVFLLIEILWPILRIKDEIK